MDNDQITQEEALANNNSDDVNAQVGVATANASTDLEHGLSEAAGPDDRGVLNCNDEASSMSSITQELRHFAPVYPSAASVADADADAEHFLEQVNEHDRGGSDDDDHAGNGEGVTGIKAPELSNNNTEACGDSDNQGVLGKEEKTPSAVDQQAKCVKEEQLQLQLILSQAEQNIEPIPAVDSQGRGPIRNDTPQPGAFAVPGPGSRRTLTASSSAAASTSSTSVPAEEEGQSRTMQGQEREIISTHANTTNTISAAVDSTLVSANPVVEQATNLDLPLAVPAEETPDNRRYNKTPQYVAGAGILIILALLIVFLVVLLPGNDANSASLATDSNNQKVPLAPNTSRITSSPTPAPLTMDLPDYTVSALQNYNSPQYKAREWILGYPLIASLEQWRQTQLFALSTIYYALHGDEWPVMIRNSFLNYETDECNWFSASSVFDLEGSFNISVYEAICPNTVAGCNDTKRAEIQRLFQLKAVPNASYICDDHGRYTTLSLLALDLGGREAHIPPEVALLPSLEKLSITFSALNASLSDMMPSQLSQLSNLTTLEFDDNNLIGAIPSTIGLLTGLQKFSVGYTGVNGFLPSELWSLRHMRELILQHNHFSAQILPSTIAQLTDLTVLDISSNLWTGRIPTEVGLLTDLEGLDLDGSLLSGQLPSEIGLLTRLEEFDLAASFLSGTLPTEYGGMVNLEELEFSATKISGSIPPQVCGLPHLEAIELNCSLVACNCGTICDCD